MSLGQELTKALRIDFQVDMEFTVVVDTIKPGQKPATDTAVCVVTTHLTKPVILFEYKPVVDLRPKHVNRDHLMEVLIQGFYCLIQYRVRAVIQCLTDLNQWYYFRLERVFGGKKVHIKYSWYKSFCGMDVKSHVSFLTSYSLDRFSLRNICCILKLKKTHVALRISYYLLLCHVAIILNLVLLST